MSLFFITPLYNAWPHHNLQINDQTVTHIFLCLTFQQRKSECECEQPKKKMNPVLRSDISVEVLQQLSKARPPGVHFLPASLQQLAEMSCLGREASATLLVSSPSNPAAPPPPLPTFHPPPPPRPAQRCLALDIPIYSTSHFASD